MSNRTLKLVVGILGVTGVALGAFGAHALKTQLATSGHTETWRTAVLYHLLHTVAIWAVTLSYRDPARINGSRFLLTTCILWAVGIVLFSGSLYALALGGPLWLGPITPIGGLALLIGWSCILISGFKKES
jgi:uncharacterized membrane protein YgdD (TMEM256/DUF423 family)